MEYRVALFNLDGNGKPLRISGYAAVWNQPSEDLGGFVEYVMPGAFTDSIQNDDVRALFNHDNNKVLGRSKNGTLKMVEDSLGLHFEVVPPEVSWVKDLAESMRRGDINQCSFGFKTLRDSWSRDHAIRHLEKAKLSDVSVVTQPAYPQTSATVQTRSWIAGRGGESRRERLARLVREVNRDAARLGVDIRPAAAQLPAKFIIAMDTERLMWGC